MSAARDRGHNREGKSDGDRYEPRKQEWKKAIKLLFFLNLTLEIITLKLGNNIYSRPWELN